MQLVDNRTPVFILHSQDLSDEVAELADRFRRLGAPTIIVGPDTAARGSDTIEIPDGVNEIYQTLNYVIPLQLFVYYSSVSRGLNPDQPTKLKKVVV